jgi:rfaE bifunctional protein kinase chain/domain
MDINREEYISTIKEKFGVAKIESYLEKSKNLNVLIIGDTIIDEYVFAQPKGRAVKDPILSVEYRNQETYAGGILAIANHVSSYVSNIKLVTLIGDINTKIDFIKKSLSNNIELKTFTKENSPTTVKKRYIDGYRNNKLFKIEYLNDRPISEQLTKEIVNYLNEELPKCDVVLIGDFGHGFINADIRNILEKKSKFFSVDSQSNSANMGYNYINHYKDPDFITMDEQEIRLPLMKRFDEMEDVIQDFHNKFKYQKFLVTIGKYGTIFFNNGTLYKAPIMVSTVVDAVGAGDAVFAITSLLVHTKADNELIPFIANCAGGIKCNIMGNKESVTKEKLTNFVKELLE